VKISSLEITGFGVWSGLKLDDLHEGLNVFYGPNEAGKTTVMDFVRSVLYGFSGPRRRYIPPVSGGAGGGSLDLVYAGQSYQVERRILERRATSESNAKGLATTSSSGTSFGASDGNGSDSDDGLYEVIEVTAPDGSRQGEHLLKTLLYDIEEPLFNGVFCIGLQELQRLGILDDTSAASMLYNLSIGGPSISMVDVMNSLTQSRLCVLDPQSETDLVRRLMMEREEILGELSSIPQRLRTYERSISSLDRLNAELGTLREESSDLKERLAVLETANKVKDSWGRRGRMEDTLRKAGEVRPVSEKSLRQLEQIQQKLTESNKKVEQLRSDREAVLEAIAEYEVQYELLEYGPTIRGILSREPWRRKTQGIVDRLQADVLHDEERLRNSSTYTESTSRLRSLPLQSLAQKLTEDRKNLSEAKQGVEQFDRSSRQLDESLRIELAKHNETDLTSAKERVGLHRRRLEERSRVQKEIESVNERSREVNAVCREYREQPHISSGALLALWFIAFCGLAILAGIHQLNWPLLLAPLGLAFVCFGFGGRYYFDHKKRVQREDAEQELKQLRHQLEEKEAQAAALDVKLPADERSLQMRLEAAGRQMNALEGLDNVHYDGEEAKKNREQAKESLQRLEHQLAETENSWRQSLKEGGLPARLTPNELDDVFSEADERENIERKLDRSREELEYRRSELIEADEEVRRILADLQREAKDVEPEPVAEIKSSPEPNRSDKRSSNNDYNNNDNKNYDNDKGSYSDYGNQYDNENDDDEDSKYLRYVTDEDDEQSSQQETQSSRDLSDRTSSTGIWAEIHTLATEIREQESHRSQRIGLMREKRRLLREYRKAKKERNRLVRTRKAILDESDSRDERELKERLERYEHVKQCRQKRDAAQREISTAIGNSCTEDEIHELLRPGEAEKLTERLLGDRERAEELRIAMDELLEEKGRCEERIRSLRGAKDEPRLMLALAFVEEKLRRSVRDWQVRATANRTLEEIRKTYETERQPETLALASGYLERLTEGRYKRVWTPMGANRLFVDAANGDVMALDLLSHGTREQLFLALRLALADTYSKQGARLPMILDDVLVNFDVQRAAAAARLIREFAEQGRQVMLFTCHRHIAEIFHGEDVPIMRLPRRYGTEPSVYLSSPKADDEPIEEPEVVVEEPVEEVEPVEEEIVVEEPIEEEIVTAEPEVEEPAEEEIDDEIEEKEEVLEEPEKDELIDFDVPAVYRVRQEVVEEDEVEEELEEESDETDEDEWDATEWEDVEEVEEDNAIEEESDEVQEEPESESIEEEPEEEPAKQEPFDYDGDLGFLASVYGDDWTRFGGEDDWDDHYEDQYASRAEIAARLRKEKQESE